MTDKDNTNSLVAAILVNAATQLLNDDCAIQLRLRSDTETQEVRNEILMDRALSFVLEAYSQCKKHL